MTLQKEPLYAVGRDLGGRLFSIVAWRGRDLYTVTIDNGTSTATLDVSEDELGELAAAIAEVIEKTA